MSKLTGRNKNPRPTQASRSPYMGEARVRVQSTKFKNKGAKQKNDPKPKSSHGLTYMSSNGKNFWVKDAKYDRHSSSYKQFDRHIGTEDRYPKPKPKARPGSKKK